MKLFSACALIGVLGSACQLEPSFTVEYTPQGDARTPTGRTIAVRVFQDDRPPVKNPSVAKEFLTYIPLIPWIDMSVQRTDEVVAKLDAEIAGKKTISFVMPVAPDAGEPIDFSFPVAMAKAIARDLKSSSGFVRVDVIGPDDTAGADLVLEGRLKDAQYVKRVSSYCLGMFGVLLWALPIPIGRKGGTVDFELTLKEVASGRELWRSELHGEVGKYFFLYNASAMIYGRKGAFSFQVLEGDERFGVDPYSMFTWEFAALREAMIVARAEIVGAAGVSQPEND